MPRLIWVFSGRTATLLVLSWGSSILYLRQLNAISRCPSHEHGPHNHPGTEHPPRFSPGVCWVYYAVSRYATFEFSVIGPVQRVFTFNLHWIPVKCLNLHPVSLKYQWKKKQRISWNWIDRNMQWRVNLSSFHDADMCQNNSFLLKTDDLLRAPLSKILGFQHPHFLPECIF